MRQVDDAFIEQLQVLLGERGEKTKPNSAVRRIELQALASLKLKSKQLTGAPTMADYNALQDDVATIFQALTLISNLYGNAKLPKP